MFKPLYGFSFKNFRGVGERHQRVKDLEQINLFIGANNSGKSAFLAFVSTHLGGFSGGTGGPRATKYGPHDVHIGKAAEHVQFEIAYSYEAFKELITQLCERRHARRPPTASQLETICQYFGPSGTIWMTFYGVTHAFAGFADVQSGRPDTFTADAVYALFQALNPHTSGGDLDHWLRSLGEILPVAVATLPKAIFVPAIRQIGPKGEDFVDNSGRGLIDQLAAIQNPGLAQRASKAKFDAINSFLRVVTDDPSATLEITHDRDAILVHMKDRLLPLSSLGTGIHEIAMLAAFCTLADNALVCIEEPEIHLHPSLQRKLMRYLVARTNNQYFIATHSSVLIDTPGAAVYHVTKDESQTIVSSAASPASRYAICADLGYRASDIIQANSIIWVEGPSDRIYLKHWIAAEAPELIEGVHFSIMFYGGRLLSHLTATTEEDVTEFIKLRLLNQNVAIVLDSDRRSESTKINATKLRVIEELSSGSGVAWLTEGREIENYVSPALIEAAVRRVHGSRVGEMVATGSYDSVLHFRTVDGGSDNPSTVVEKIDKVRVAKFVCEQQADLSILDLKQQVLNLVSMIQRANE